MTREEAANIIRHTVVMVLEGNVAEFEEAVTVALEALRQGGWIPCSRAVDIGYLTDWYISSVMDDEPVWTEKHIEELFNDFILIPKPHKGVE